MKPDRGQISWGGRVLPVTLWTEEPVDVRKHHPGRLMHGLHGRTVALYTYIPQYESNYLRRIIASLHKIPAVMLPFNSIRTCSVYFIGVKKPVKERLAKQITGVVFIITGRKPSGVDAGMPFACTLGMLIQVVLLSIDDYLSGAVAAYCCAADCPSSRGSQYAT
jgi:hypothetical protein